MIPNKSTFKFQELTPITGVKPYVIRFWETEFEEIAPITSDSGQKLYARKDVEAILKIKKLLFDEKMNIPEAKAALKTRDVEITNTSHSYDEEANTSNFSALKGHLETALEFVREIKAKHSW